MPEWAFVFFGIICLLIVLGCAFLLIRKLFGKKRHGEKNKQKGGGLKGFFGGKGGAMDTDFGFTNKLQTDLENLEDNMEQNEKEQAEEKEEVCHLHRSTLLRSAIRVWACAPVMMRSKLYTSSRAGS